MPFTGTPCASLEGTPPLATIELDWGPGCASKSDGLVGSLVAGMAMPLWAAAEPVKIVSARQGMVKRDMSSYL